MNSKTSEIIYYRRCHVCEGISEEEAEVQNCRFCQKPFLQYFFCEDLSQFFNSSEINKIHTGDRIIPPIIGISFIWLS